MSNTAKKNGMQLAEEELSLVDARVETPPTSFSLRCVKEACCGFFVDRKMPTGGSLREIIRGETRKANAAKRKGGAK